MHYSHYFKLPHSEFVKSGVFDGLIERDIPLHVDPMLLKSCKIPEFKGAYNKFLDYFNEIVTLSTGMSDPLIKKDVLSKLLEGCTSQRSLIRDWGILNRIPKVVVSVENCHSN